ncbi:bifunctional 2-polyprenyl-6-hydroxyphenol methylase/3-demethylubiquinol 3-O-methyltransferase UbiG [Streptomyces sp. 8N616]|uniref:bifunctional 2-polyprenyl-6-hydroxyphenol methylase/3-demethylubiquinol 3-O-methyltransferase UbiG n=1 Tax=Streptomyces sp. 8N616 TaxID=3457414 RepID=UPI003FD10A91
MAVDNEIYNEPGLWWDDNQPMATLLALTVARFDYFHEALGKHGVNLAGARVLDVGCGGGLLAEEFAKAGAAVTGVDPSAESLEAARMHAAPSGLKIDYRHGTAEELAFPDASFDLVYCCDVLEHVSDVDASVGEAARVLKPGGYYLYDTINRTLRSKLIMIKLFQEWEAFRWAPRDLHDWDKFIKPAELAESLRRHGLDNVEFVGFGPEVNPFKVLRLLRQRVRGEISYGAMGRHMKIRACADTSGGYGGHARKSG